MSDPYLIHHTRDPCLPYILLPRSIYLPGPQGLQGIPGPIGPPGPSGFQGYGQVISANLDPVEVSFLSPIPFTSRRQSNIIAYSEDTSTITMTRSGVYKISFNLTSSTLGNKEISISRNDVIEITSSSSSDQVSGEFIIEAQTGDAFQLVNSSLNTLRLDPPPGPNGVNGSIIFLLVG